jgi:hypothetical protein
VQQSNSSQRNSQSTIRGRQMARSMHGHGVTVDRNGRGVHAGRSGAPMRWPAVNSATMRGPARMEMSWIIGLGSGYGDDDESPKTLEVFADVAFGQHRNYPHWCDVSRVTATSSGTRKKLQRRRCSPRHGRYSASYGDGIEMCIRRMGEGQDGVVSVDGAGFSGCVRQRSMCVPCRGDGGVPPRW